MAVSRWQAIHDDLKRRIESGELGVGASLPSEMALADEWAVSRLTAHRALYELQRSGLVLRRRRVGTVVASRSEASTCSVTVVLFDGSDYFQGKWLAGINAALGEACHVVYNDTTHNARLEAEVLQRASREWNGAVLFPTCDPSNMALLRKLDKAGFPLVCIDRAPEGLAMDAVTTDNRAAVRTALDHLREGGHRRVAYFTDAEVAVSTVRERLRAYQDFMTESVGEPNRYLREFPYLEPSSTEEFDLMIRLARDALVALNADPEPPTAVLCLREHWAAAVDEALRTLPEGRPDWPIASFIDRPSWLMRFHRPIHRIEQDVDGMAAIAAQRLQMRLAGERPTPEHFRVPATFVPVEAQG